VTVPCFPVARRYTGDVLWIKKGVTVMVGSMWTLWVIFMTIFAVLVVFAVTWLMSHRHS
jgi:uncharacterized membrane protein